MFHLSVWEETRPPGHVKYAICMQPLCLDFRTKSNTNYTDGLKHSMSRHSPKVYTRNMAWVKIHSKPLNLACRATKVYKNHMTYTYIYIVINLRLGSNVKTWKKNSWFLYKKQKTPPKTAKNFKSIPFSKGIVKTRRQSAKSKVLPKDTTSVKSVESILYSSFQT